MQVAGLTNRGKERARNEDSLFLKADSGYALLVVADGMGGHRAGNIASSMAVSAAEETWNNLDLTKPLSGDEAGEILQKFITAANQQILEEANKTLSKRGMGTTLTSCLIYKKELTIGHIGDSRAYLIQNGVIRLLTKDHSLLEQLIDSGQLKPENAHLHPQRHVLTRALGTSYNIKVDLVKFELADCSTLLLCTDGLTNMVSDNEILEISNDEPDPYALAEALIKKANVRGGFDNITVVIASGIGGQGN